MPVDLWEFEGGEVLRVRLEAEEGSGVYGGVAEEEEGGNGGEGKGDQQDLAEILGET